MIRILQTEADCILKNIPNARLFKTSARKRRGGKTYYALSDDIVVLKAIAEMRGFNNIVEMLEKEDW